MSETETRTETGGLVSTPELSREAYVDAYTTMLGRCARREYKVLDDVGGDTFNLTIYVQNDDGRNSASKEHMEARFTKLALEGKVTVYALPMEPVSDKEARGFTAMQRAHGMAKLAYERKKASSPQVYFYSIAALDFPKLSGKYRYEHQGIVRRGQIDAAMRTMMYCKPTMGSVKITDTKNNVSRTLLPMQADAFSKCAHIAAIGGVRGNVSSVERVPEQKAKINVVRLTVENGVSFSTSAAQEAIGIPRGYMSVQNRIIVSDEIAGITKEDDVVTWKSDEDFVQASFGLDYLMEGNEPELIINVAYLMRTEKDDFGVTTRYMFPVFGDDAKQASHFQKRVSERRLDESVTKLRNAWIESADERIEEVALKCGVGAVSSEVVALGRERIAEIQKFAGASFSQDTVSQDQWSDENGYLLKDCDAFVSRVQDQVSGVRVSAFENEADGRADRGRRVIRSSASVKVITNDDDDSSKADKLLRDGSVCVANIADVSFFQSPGTPDKVGMPYWQGRIKFITLDPAGGRTVQIFECEGLFDPAFTDGYTTKATMFASKLHSITAWNANSIPTTTSTGAIVQRVSGGIAETGHRTRVNGYTGIAGTTEFNSAYAEQPLQLVPDTETMDKHPKYISRLHGGLTHSSSELGMFHRQEALGLRRSQEDDFFLCEDARDAALHEIRVKMGVSGERASELFDAFVNHVNREVVISGVGGIAYAGHVHVTRALLAGYSCTTDMLESAMQGPSTAIKIRPTLGMLYATPLKTKTNGAFTYTFGSRYGSNITVRDTKLVQELTSGRGVPNKMNQMPSFAFKDSKYVFDAGRVATVQRGKTKPFVVKRVIRHRYGLPCIFSLVTKEEVVEAAGLDATIEGIMHQIYLDVISSKRELAENEAISYESFGGITKSTGRALLVTYFGTRQWSVALCPRGNVDDEMRFVR